MALEVTMRATQDNFDAASYLRANPEIAKARAETGLDPAWHFKEFGRTENRSLRLSRSPRFAPDNSLRFQHTRPIRSARPFP